MIRYALTRSKKTIVAGVSLVALLASLFSPIGLTPSGAEEQQQSFKTSDYADATSFALFSECWTGYPFQVRERTVVSAFIGGGQISQQDINNGFAFHVAIFSGTRDGIFTTDGLVADAVFAASGAVNQVEDLVDPVTLTPNTWYFLATGANKEPLTPYNTGRYNIEEMDLSQVVTEDSVISAWPNKSSTSLLVGPSSVCTGSAAGVVGWFAPGQEYPKQPAIGFIHSPAPLRTITGCSASFALSNPFADQLVDFDVQSISGGSTAFAEARVDGNVIDSSFVELPATGSIPAFTPPRYGGTTFSFAVYGIDEDDEPVGEPLCEASFTVQSPSFDTLTLPNATVGVPYSQELTYDPSEGYRMLDCLTAAKNLPAGLSISRPQNLPAGSCGTVSGTPTNAGSSTIEASLKYEPVVPTPRMSTAANHESGNSLEIKGEFVLVVENSTTPTNPTTTTTTSPTNANSSSGSTAAPVTPRFTG
jgi:hypothetical protein